MSKTNKTLLAGCIVLDEYDRMLLLHYSGEEYGTWEVPGGEVDDDEAPDMAAARVLRERLGVTAAITASLGKDNFEQDEHQYEYHWFAATIVTGEPRIMASSSFDDLGYFEIEDLPSLALTESMLLLQHKLLTGEISL